MVFRARKVFGTFEKRAPEEYFCDILWQTVSGTEGSGLVGVGGSMREVVDFDARKRASAADISKWEGSAWIAKFSIAHQPSLLK